MCGDEVEVRQRRRRLADYRDAGVLAVARCLVEGPRQRTPLLGPDWRTIQPIDPIQGPGHRPERPFPFRTVGNRQSCDIAGRIVAGQHGVTLPLPAIVSLGVAGGPAGARSGPPLGRVDRDRVQRDEVAYRAGPAAGDAENHGRIPICVGEAEAARIELQPGDRVGRTALTLAQRRPVMQDGVSG